MFINHYFCTECDTGWTDKWESMVDDRCPMCDREVEPHKSQDLLLGGVRVNFFKTELHLDYTAYFEMARSAMASIPEDIAKEMDISDAEFLRLRDQLEEMLGE